jgi:hypothetical protein
MSRSACEVDRNQALSRRINIVRIGLEPVIAQPMLARLLKADLLDHVMEIFPSSQFISLYECHLSGEGCLGSGNRRFHQC